LNKLLVKHLLRSHFLTIISALSPVSSLNRHIALPPQPCFPPITAGWLQLSRWVGILVSSSSLTTHTIILPRRSKRTKKNICVRCSLLNRQDCQFCASPAHHRSLDADRMSLEMFNLSSDQMMRLLTSHLDLTYLSKMSLR
jgi:hypothetical protein